MRAAFLYIFYYCLFSLTKYIIGTLTIVTAYFTKKLKINIPKSLLELNIPREDIDSLTESAFEVQRLLQNNPKTVTKEDIKKIYKKLF